MTKADALVWIRDSLWKALNGYHRTRYMDTPRDNYDYANELALRFWGRPLRTRLCEDLPPALADPAIERANIERARALPPHACGMSGCALAGCGGLWFAYGARIAEIDGRRPARAAPPEAYDGPLDRPGRGGRPVRRRRSKLTRVDGR